MNLKVKFEEQDQRFGVSFEETEQSFDADMGEIQRVQGKDGVSPIVTVEDLDSGHRVTITDKEGTKTFDVMDGTNGIDGKDGADGHTPVKGMDYFTEADKQEMVDDVIAQIPPSGVSDVQLNGATIVDENGVATIPIVTSNKGGYGIVRVGNLSNGQMGVRNINGAIALAYPEASINGFTNRKAQGSQYSGTVSSANFDLAVKVAMTDGVGATWTEEEKAAARTRMGAVSLEEVLASLPVAEGASF